MESYPEPVTKQSTKKILEQMDNSIYKINTKNGKYDIGIFCKIKIRNVNIPVFITSFKIFKEKNILENNKIKVSIGNKIEIITLGDKKYFNEELDISVLEIKENKNNKISYLELDDILYEKEPEIFYNKETIYILHYIINPINF